MMAVKQYACVFVLALFTANAVRVDEDPDAASSSGSEDADAAQAATEAQAGAEEQSAATQAQEIEDEAAASEEKAPLTAKQAQENLVKSVREVKTKQEKAQSTMRHLVAAQLVSAKKAHSSKTMAKKAVKDEEMVGKTKKASMKADAAATEAYIKEADARTTAEELAIQAKVINTGKEKQETELEQKKTEVGEIEEHRADATVHAEMAAAARDKEAAEAQAKGATAKYYEERESAGLQDVAKAKENLKTASAEAGKAQKAKDEADGLLENAKKVAEEKSAAKTAAEKAFADAQDADLGFADKAVELYMAHIHAETDSKEANKLAQEKAAAEKAAAAKVIANKAATAAAAARGSAEAAQAKLLKAANGLGK